MTTIKMHLFNLHTLTTILVMLTMTMALTHRPAVAETALQPPAAVAVRYDGWIPQGGGFNHSDARSSFAMGRAIQGSNSKASSVTTQWIPPTMSVAPHMKLSGAAWTVIPYPTQVAFERQSGDTKLNFTFRSGNRSDSAAFWPSIFAVEFTETTMVNGQERQTALGDCQVSQVTWL